MNTDDNDDDDDHSKKFFIQISPWTKREPKASGNIKRRQRVMRFSRKKSLFYARGDHFTES